MTEAFRTLTIQLFDFIWQNATIAAVAGPVITIGLVLRVLRWSRSLSHGATFEGLESDFNQVSGQLSPSGLRERYATARRRRGMS